MKTLKKSCRSLIVNSAKQQLKAKGLKPHTKKETQEVQSFINHISNQDGKTMFSNYSNDELYKFCDELWEQKERIETNKLQKKYNDDGALATFVWNITKEKLKKEFEIRGLENVFKDENKKV